MVSQVEEKIFTCSGCNQLKWFDWEFSIDMKKKLNSIGQWKLYLLLALQAQCSNHCFINQAAKSSSSKNI